MKKIFLLLMLILIFFSAGLFAAHQTGFINLNPILSKIPGMSSFVIEPAETTSDPEDQLISPIEKENQKLRKENKDLEFKLTTLEGEKTGLLEQVTDLQAELTELKASITAQTTAALNADELAVYYQKMDPKAAIKIMENLEDETVMIILPRLESKQSAEIISLMDPLRAAIITQLLLDKNQQ